MGSGAREERENRDGLFAWERTGMGKRKKSRSGKRKESKGDTNKMLRQMTLINNACSGTGNSELMQINFSG